MSAAAAGALQVTFADRVLVAAGAALVGVLFAAYWQPPSQADWVEVRSGRAVVGRYPLSEPRTLHVEGRLGRSELRIEDGRVRFVSGPCLNRVCVRTGWLRHHGEAAACVPNGVSLGLEGGGEAAFDAISH